MVKFVLISNVSNIDIIARIFLTLQFSRNYRRLFRFLLEAKAKVTIFSKSRWFIFGTIKGSLE